jgi:hypothetical protein
VVIAKALIGGVLGGVLLILTLLVLGCYMKCRGSRAEDKDRLDR